MSYASTIFAFLVALTGTLVSGCFLSREPDTQSMYRKEKRLGQTHANTTFALELTGISWKSRFFPASKFLRQNNDNLINLFLIWLQKNGVVFGSSIPIIRDAK